MKRIGKNKTATVSALDYATKYEHWLELAAAAGKVTCDYDTWRVQPFEQRLAWAENMLRKVGSK
jgi:hypothetical protein